MRKILSNETKIYLIALFSNLSIYACSTYYFSAMRESFNLPISFNYKLLALNGIGIIGNFGFTYWAFKRKNHRFIIGTLIIIQSLAFFAIYFLSLLKGNIIKYFSIFFIGTTNAISNGGFNPVFDSLSINFLETHSKLVKINTLRGMVALGNLFTGIIINIISFIIKHDKYVPISVSLSFAILSCILINRLSYNYSMSKKKEEKNISNKISVLEIVKYFLKLNFIIFYLVIIFNGSYKLYYTMLQRDQLKSYNLKDSDMNWVKTVGCFAEILYSCVFHKIEALISFKIIFPLSVILNVIKFFIFSSMKIEDYKYKLQFLMFMESIDKVIFFMTNVSGNRILLNICKIEFLTLAQGIRYACFTGLGCILAGLSGINLSNSTKKTLNADDFRHIFSRTKYISILTILLSVILMIILLFFNNNLEEEDTD